MADTRTYVSTLPGIRHTLHGRDHSRDTAIECLKKSLQRDLDRIQAELAALNNGDVHVSIWRGSNNLPLRAFTPTGCRWCGTEPARHGDLHTYEPPTPEQVKARTTVKVTCHDIELDDGENLSALGVGGYLETSRETAGLCAGTWLLVEYHGDSAEEATLRLLSAEEITARRNAEAFAQIYA